MTRMATAPGSSATDRKPVGTAAKYLLKRKHMMRYADGAVPPLSMPGRRPTLRLVRGVE